MHFSLSEEAQDRLHHLFGQGALGASQALSKWLAEDVQLLISKIDLLELAKANELLGPAENIVTACTMGLRGRLTGLMLLIFEEKVGFGLVDLLMHQPIGTTTAWGAMEESAVKETMNIVGCAYANALSAHTAGCFEQGDDGVHEPQDDGQSLVPTPPTLTSDFAGSLLECAVIDQAMECDQILMIGSHLSAVSRNIELNCTLLFIPSGESFHTLWQTLCSPVVAKPN
jgi:chemotaxis protein CheC